jgi:hypothetical protein
MTDKVKVIFRKDKKNGDIIAFFPEILTNRYNIMSYMHIGQHSEASLEYYTNDTQNAKPDEYKSLLSELKRIYEDDKTQLTIRTKLNYNDLKKSWV